jgi:hypothetical protein
MSFDSLFVPDYSQIDVSKYDEVIPIESIKQTKI